MSVASLWGEKVPPEVTDTVADKFGLLTSCYMTLAAVKLLLSLWKPNCYFSQTKIQNYIHDRLSILQLNTRDTDCIRFGYNCFIEHTHKDKT